MEPCPENCPPIEVLWIYLVGILTFLVMLCMAARFEFKIPWFIRDNGEDALGLEYNPLEVGKDSPGVILILSVFWPLVTIVFWLGFTLWLLFMITRLLMGGISITISATMKPDHETIKAAAEYDRIKEKEWEALEMEKT